MSLLNKKATRELILKVASEERPSNRFTRVSESSIKYLERRLVEIIRAQVHSHPSVGKTLKFE